MFIISDTHGRFWTGRCFGVEQAAETYETVRDLPGMIDVDGETAYCAKFAADDIRYYPEAPDHMDWHDVRAVAWAVAR